MQFGVSARVESKSDDGINFIVSIERVDDDLLSPLVNISLLMKYHIRENTP